MVLGKNEFHSMVLTKALLGKSSNGRGDRGFTLVELLIVLVVGGVLAGITVLTLLNGRDSLLADDTANRLRSRIQDARVQAIRRNEAIAIYQVDANTVAVELGGCNNNPANILAQFDVAEQADNIAISWSNAGGVIWQGNGLAQGCMETLLTTQVIEVQRDGMTAETITIEGTAGRVQQL